MSTIPMTLNYAVGYDRGGSITVGYTFTGPTNEITESTFTSSDATVLAAAEALFAAIATAHSLTRKPTQANTDAPLVP